MRSAALLLALAVVALTVNAEDESSSLGAVEKRCRAAFGRLDFPSADRLRSSIDGRMPRGVVTVPTPFAVLVEALLEPFELRMREREEALAALTGHPARKTGKLLQDAVKALAEENRALAREVRAAEAVYAGVGNRRYLEMSVKERWDRKAVAVQIPFYRRLLLRNAEVRESVGDTLATMWKPDDFAWLVKEASECPDQGFRWETASALGRLRREAARAALVRIARMDELPGVRLAALVALQQYPVRDVFEAVIAALRDPAWEVRAMAIRIIACAGLLSATGPMIEALTTEEGRLVTDLDTALGVLTGASMEADPEQWEKWWAAHREEVEKKSGRQFADGAFDDPLGPVESWVDPVGEAPDEGAATFYGIPTNSRRVVFLIDISRNMDRPAGAFPAVTGSAGNPYEAPEGKTRLAVAKWQLHRAIHELPKEARFNLIVYSESYRVWRPGMIAAKPKEKRRAHRFIDDLRPNGTTNFCDSLDRALEMAGMPPPLPDADLDELAVDTIFLVSAGVLNRGRITDLNELMDDIGARTSSFRVAIHTVGIGEAAGSTFLDELAILTGGSSVGFE